MHGIQCLLYNLPLAIFDASELVYVENHRLGIGLPHLLVLMLQTDPHKPDRGNRHERKRDTRHPCLQEARVIRTRPQIWSVDTTHVTQRITQRERDGFLFWCLTKSCTSPAEHDVVDAEGKRDEDEYCDEACGNVGGDSRNDEADNDDGLADGDVPCALIVASRGVRHDYCHCCSQEVRRTCECKGDRSAVAESLDDGRQEGLEADGGDVSVVHQAKDPSAPVSQGLAQADPDTGGLLALSGIGCDALVSELPFGFVQPASLERVVGEHEEGHACHANGKCALDEKEPRCNQCVI